MSPTKKPAVEQPVGDFDCCVAWASDHRARHAEERAREKAAAKAAKEAARS